MTTPGGFAVGAAGPRLLAVHAHPDDETLSTGALLASWAASGAPVTVVTCTRGERGEVIGPALAHLEGDGPALAAHRARELAAALAALGVTDHVWLDTLATAAAPDHPAPDHPAPNHPAPDHPAGDGRYEDSGMIWWSPGRAGAAPDSGPAAFARADLELAARRLGALLHERRPDVVVTYEPDGGYGHPDHVRAHEVTMRAVALASAADPSLAPVVLWAAVDAAALGRAADELRSATAGADGMPDGVRLPGRERTAPSAAVAPDEVALRVDVLPVLDAVVGALRAHATQIQAVRTWADAAEASVGCLALSDGVLQPLLRHEAYRVAAGDVRRVSWPGAVSG